ncbi:MAG: paraslipin [Burkholderiales bacterium]|nr:paraslipin [Burkholderiales bacterium]
MGFEIVVVVLFVFVAVTVWKGVRIVPQGEEWIVERLGKFHQNLAPGLSIIIPYLDKVAYKVITKDIILDVPEQEVITKDNAVIITNAIAFIKVTDPVKAVYGIVDFAEAIRNLVQTTLRSITGEMELDQALSSREKIKVRLKESISDEAIDWGLTIKSVEIQDIKPSESMVKSMELQAAAERERKAVVTKAEGAKQAMILEAEGRLESAKRDAVAQVTLADSAAQAIGKVAAAVGDRDAPMLFLLGEKYIQAVDRMAGSPNSKIVLLPADLQEAVRGLFARK